MRVLEPSRATGIWQRGAAIGNDRKRRRAHYTIVGALAVWSVGIGLLLGVSGYYDHFRHFNPSLFAAVSRTE